MAHSYRQYTIKISFNNEFARPKAFEIERFIREELKIDPQDMIGIHFSITSSVVYVKLINDAVCNKIVRDNKDGLKFNHSDGNVGAVAIDHAGLGLRTVRVFELPFEVPADTVVAALQPYGRVLSHIAEKWTTFTTYPVLNGVRQVRIELAKHVPSYLTIGGCRAIIIYDGQPKTCSGCGQEGHVRSACLQRRIVQVPTGEAAATSTATSLPLTYADVSRKDTPLNNELTQQHDVPDEEPTVKDGDTRIVKSATAPAEQLQTIPTTEKTAETMDIDTRIVPTAAFVPNDRGDGEARPHSDTETHVRKQRSPRRHKKRRLTPSDDCLTRTTNADQDQAQEDGYLTECSETSHPERHRIDSNVRQERHEGFDAAGLPTVRQQSMVVDETKQSDGAEKNQQPANSFLGDWADDFEGDPPMTTMNVTAGAEPPPS